MSAPPTPCAACGRPEDIAVDDCDAHLARLGAMIDAGRDTKPENVVDLAAAREQRDRADASAAHARGEAFAFDLRDDLAEDDAPVGHSAGVVTILLDAQALSGICLTPAAARKLGTTLIELAVMAEHGIGDDAPPAEEPAR